MHVRNSVDDFDDFDDFGNKTVNQNQEKTYLFLLFFAVPSFVNGLYTPLGSIDSLPPPYLPRYRGRATPLAGSRNA